MSAVSQGLANYEPALKEYIASQAPIIYKYESKFFELLELKTAYGDTWRLPLALAPASGMSANFTTARNNRRSAKYRDFKINTDTQTADLYQEFGVTNKLIEMSKSAEGAIAVEKILGAFENEAKAAMDNFMGRAHVQAWRNGTGSIGKLAASGAVSGTTLTLAERAEANNFEVGMVLEGSATDGSAILSGTAEVTAVDRDAGTIEVASQGISGLTNDYFLYLAGTGQNGTSNEERVIRGVPAWLPLAAPTSGDDWFGVDRSVDTDRLAGVRYDGSSLGTHRGAIKRLLTRIHTISSKARPLDLFLHPEDMEIVSNELENGSTMFPMPEGEFGHTSIKAMISPYTVRLHSETHQQKGVFHALDMSTWCMLHSDSGFPFLDPTTREHAQNEDSQVGMIKAYCQLGCKAPGYNGVGAFRTV